ncbi:tetratricopeptide repeat protein 16 [Manis pentadactyla]|uniref:tetratricopeptide repeat protein 16 n=1 Tax=Manis pentadactyla TaxID=143292 RepID=UPI00255CD7C8|nr:tetratricopeptide repeat protein 16 [Manis pentadactyla]
MADSEEVRGGKLKQRRTEDLRRNALGFDQAPLEHILKPWVFPGPEGTLQRVFGTSQVFWRVDDTKPKVVGLTVPLKVREYCHEGHQCLEQRDWETAVLLFSRALHLDSQLVDFYALRAEAYIQLCDFSSAAQNLRRAHSFQPENASYLERLTFVLYLQGQCLFEQCAFLDALQVFSKASALQPEKPCFRYQCMACLLALKRHHDCLSLVSKEVQCGTTNADVYILRARLHNFFQKAEALTHPTPQLPSRVVVPSLCQVCASPWKPPGERPMSSLPLQISQPRGDVPKQMPHTMISRVSVAPREVVPRDPLEKPKLCYQDLHSALLLDPKHPQAKVLLQMMVDQAQQARQDAGILAVQGKLQHALQRISSAIENNPLDPNLFLFRGTIYRRLQEFDAAVEDLLKALDMTTEGDMVQQAQRQLLLAYSDFAVHRSMQGAYQEGVLPLSKALRTSSRRKASTSTAELLPLMTSLFPGMSVEEVLSSQVAHLSRLQLHRVVESAAQASIAQGIMGQLRKQELERQKARALPSSWMLGQTLSETSEEQKATPQALQAEPHRPEEEAHAPKEQEEEKEEKPELIPSKRRPLSDSYLDQTSSGSVLGFRTMSILGTETSTICQEYRRTSTTAVTFSGSSLLKTQSSELGSDRDLSLCHSPRKTKTTQSHRPSKLEAMQGHSHKSSRMEAAQSQSSSKTEAMKGQSWRPSRTKATQGPR